jgi:hypothetical protein
MVYSAHNKVSVGDKAYDGHDVFTVVEVDGTMMRIVGTHTGASLWAPTGLFRAPNWSKR